MEPFQAATLSTEANAETFVIFFLPSKCFLIVFLINS